MKVVIAIDSFKGSLSSLQAGRAAASGIRRAFPDANIQVCPLADGGEGTVDALTEGLGGRLRQIRVTGPLGDPVECQYGIIQESQTAILEMSKAAGLPLVPYEKRDPLTYNAAVETAGWLEETGGIRGKAGIEEKKGQTI